MTVEIHSPKAKVSKAFLDAVKKDVIALSHLNKNISRGEINLHEDKALRKQNKVCEIRLDIFGETIFVRRETDTFEKSATAVLKELKKLVAEQAKHSTEPPDVTTSTVKV